MPVNTTKKGLPKGQGGDNARDYLKGAIAGGGLWTALDTLDNSILDTLVDAKGDLIVGTAADTVARKALGTNNSVLVADSAQSDGLAWSTTLAGLVLTTPHMSAPFVDSGGLNVAGGDVTLAVASKLVWNTDTNLYRAAADVLRTDDTVSVVRGTSTDNALTANVSGDSFARFLLDASGKMTWGNGTVVDTNLYRAGADTLKTDDGLQVGAGLSALGGSAIAAYRSDNAHSGGWRYSSTGDQLRYLYDGAETTTFFDGIGNLYAGGGVPATTGAVRLANTVQIAWRNAANSNNVVLSVDGSDRLNVANTNMSTSALTGGAIAMPANCVTTAVVVFNGTQYRLPLFS